MATIPTIEEKVVEALSICLISLLPATWASAQIVAKFADGHDTAVFTYKDVSGDTHILDPGFDVFDQSMQILSDIRETAVRTGHSWTQVLFSILPSGNFKFEYGYGVVEIF